MTVTSVRAPHTTRPDRRGELTLLVHQIRYEQLSFWRNPQSAFFTFAFPVVIIVIFGAVFHGSARSSFYFGLTGLQYYIPTIAAVSVLGSCYSQLAIILSMRQQNGILKRLRATPLPAWIYFVGLLVHCVMIGIVDVALIIGIGSLYGVALPTH
jgi:ABC-2 type transport system permease protein